MRDVQRMGRRQPDVAINPRALVKPPFGERCVQAHGQYVLLTVVREIRQVKPERGVAAEVFAQVVAVEDHHGAAKGAVKLNRDARARVRRRNVEHAPVPPDARLRISPAQWLGPMIRPKRVFEGKLNRPIVGQVNRFPTAVVELQTCDRQKTS